VVTSRSKHAPNRRAINRRRGALDPIEGREAVVVAGDRIGAVREQNLDGSHKAGLGGVVQRRGVPAVGPLSGEALVVDTCTMTQERRDKLGVVLSSLVAGACEPDPRPRPIDARPRAREYRCELRMKNPAAGADRCRARSPFEQHHKHGHTLARDRGLDRASATEQGLIGLRDA